MADPAHPDIDGIVTLQSRRAMARPIAVAPPGGAYGGSILAPIG